MGMLDGKVAIITGSGRGIGKASALAMAREGAAVVINDMDPAPAEETVKEITAAGGKAVACVGDVTAADFPEKFVKTALNEFGGLHVVVNNAGFTWDGMIHKMTDEQWQKILELHLGTPFRILRAAGAYFREAVKAEGAEGKRVTRKVVNVMSLAGTNGNPGQANYASAKAGLGGLTKTVAKEWGALGINVNAVAFGVIGTRLTDDKENGEKIGEISLGIPKAMREGMLQMVPMRRGGTVEEAAGPILFLASPLSDYITGHILKIDGGAMM